MKLAIISLAAAISTAGCTSTGVLTAGVLAGGTTLMSSVLSPGQADPDNQAYLDACVKQFEEQRAAAEARTTAISAAIGAANDKSLQGSLVMLLAVDTLKAEPFKCQVDRKPGFVESFTGDGLIAAGLRLYDINRQGAYTKRQLESDDKRFQLQMEDSAAGRRDMNNFWSGLIGNYGQRNPSPSYSTTTSTFGTAPE